jgi:hypothetical protein
MIHCALLHGTLAVDQPAPLRANLRLTSVAA